MANEVVPAVEPAAPPAAPVIPGSSPETPAHLSQEQPVDLDAPEDSAPDGAPEPAVTEPVIEAESDAVPQDAPAPPDAPRSWSKEDKELFGSLPPETQARLAERERLREADFLRRQNEQTEALSGLTAKQKAAEQAQQQYEAAIPLALQVQNAQMMEQFGDLMTPQGNWDQQKLDQIVGSERFAQWQWAQQKQSRLQSEITQIAQRQQEESAKQFQELAAQADKKFVEMVPEMADPVKADIYQKAALKTLTNLGYESKEISAAFESNPAFRDPRMQKLIFMASRWEEAQERAKSAVPKQQPKPLLPGAGRPVGPAADLTTAAERGDMATYIQLRKKGAVR